MNVSTSRFSLLSDSCADPLLAIMKAYAQDERPEKIDLGVGVFRDDNGQTPVMRSVKLAEHRLWTTQDSKRYLGAEGDADFTAAIRDLVFDLPQIDARLAGLQTVGGTGALRLAFDLLALDARKKVLVGSPTWPNHLPLLGGAGLEAEAFEFFDRSSQTCNFQNLIDAAIQAPPGQAILLQAGCHNPSGADFSTEQWDVLFEIIAQRGLVPILDFAYHGLGHSLEIDAIPIRKAAAILPELIVAYSCDKNFGLYRERTGALFVLSENSAVRSRVQAGLENLARATWSMPPDHGAAVVRTVLEDGELSKLWREEVEAMAGRINGIRKKLASADPALAHLEVQRGMFSLFDLSREQIERLRCQYAVYIVGSGRANLCGLTCATLDRFVDALAAVGYCGRHSQGT